MVQQVPLTNKTRKDVPLNELRLIFDLDGVIAIHPEDKDLDYVFYSTPDTDLISLLKELHDHGVTIILHTARKMRSTGGNMGELLKLTAMQTIEWLNTNDVPFDEIYFGKPYGHVYYDDLSMSYSRYNMISHLKSLLPGESNV